MTYGPEEASRDLTSVAENTASFEERARLEHHLLTLLREQGTEAVASLLQSLPGHRFTSAGIAAPDQEIRFVSACHGPKRLVVTTFLGPHSHSVDVAVEDATRVPPAPDPRHVAFYEIWESMLGLPDSEVAKLPPERKAVFLVGLLEAEVMNGGLGQYLANTGGLHLADTVECLARIGAEKTRAILIEVGELGAAAESYGATWEAHGEELDRLTNQFMESGEDLAGSTADVFIIG